MVNKLAKTLFQTKLNVTMGFTGGSVVKNLSANAGDVGLIPGSGRSSGVGNGNPLHSAWKILWTEEPGELRSMGSQSQT